MACLCLLKKLLSFPIVFDLCFQQASWIWVHPRSKSKLSLRAEVLIRVCPFEKGLRRYWGEYHKGSISEGNLRLHFHWNVGSYIRFRVLSPDSWGHSSVSWFFWRCKQNCYTLQLCIGRLLRQWDCFMKQLKRDVKVLLLEETHGEDVTNYCCFTRWSH